MNIDQYAELLHDLANDGDLDDFAVVPSIQDRRHVDGIGWTEEGGLGWVR